MKLVLSTLSSPEFATVSFGSGDPGLNTKQTAGNGSSYGADSLSITVKPGKSAAKE